MTVIVFLSYEKYNTISDRCSTVVLKVYGIYEWPPDGVKYTELIGAKKYFIHWFKIKYDEKYVIHWLNMKYMMKSKFIHWFNIKYDTKYFIHWFQIKYDDERMG